MMLGVDIFVRNNIYASPFNSLKVGGSFLKKYGGFMRVPLFFVLLFLSSISWSDCDGTSCTGVKVNRLFVTTTGNLSIGTSGSEKNLDCDAGKSGYIKLERDAPNFNQIYSLLLAAHTSEKTLWVRTYDGDGPCKILYVVSDL
ncbi:Uncharacterised protein [BD1-7 clade bacterium]|uniref:Uncharacterized protein n=1 Tax=BD1-7 clade bacterium TaxID=2029982 RepID=A0A5S9QX98_9GAMM|nr:Uncharacterised protein [BD1-7 clade bacterium]